MDMLVLLSLIIRGITLGGVFACLGLGAFIWRGVMRIVNLTHGDYAVLSAYLCFVFLTFFRIDPLLIMPLILVIMFSLGFAVQKFFINRFLPGDITRVVLITFALGFIIKNMLQLIFTVDERSLYLAHYRQAVGLGPLEVPLLYLISLAFAFVVFVALHLFLKRTLLGKAMRAIPVDAEAAKMLGIDPKQVYNYAMGLATMLAAVGGTILGLLYQFSPASGFEYMSLAIGVVIIGGFAHVKGTIVGSLILGLVYVLSGFFFGILYQTVAVYLTILVTLCIRPTGIFKSEE
ncbi:MAG: branched-chain amino acid ABC transporter permease [Candidatus Bathyarchaeia archaeon]